MPRAAPRPCSAPGCTHLLQRGTRCPVHGAVYIRARNQQQRERRQAMYTDGWAKASKAFLMRNPVCVVCLSRGVSRAATVTDHIVPHRGDSALFWDETNWQALCKRHHDRKTFAEETMPRVRPDLPPPSCRVRLVCGPPASGKTTLVRKRMKRGDVVIDLDEIFASLTGQSPHAPKGKALADALRVRNDMLAGLSRQPPDAVAWVVLSAPIRERQWWERALSPEEVIVMNTPRAECEARIATDPERAAVRVEQTRAVRRWWRAEVGA